MTTEEHRHVNMETPHMKFWNGIKAEAAECVKEMLEGGNKRVTLHEAIGKHQIEEPEDWDALMDYCKTHNAHCHDISRLHRAAAEWLQAHNEIRYKIKYP